MRGYASERRRKISGLKNKHTFFNKNFLKTQIWFANGSRQISNNDKLDEVLFTGQPSFSTKLQEI